MTNWISVDKRMPVKGKHVYIKTNKGNYYCGNCLYDKFDNKNWINPCTYLSLDEKITHWAKPDEIE